MATIHALFPWPLTREGLQRNTHKTEMEHSESYTINSNERSLREKRTRTYIQVRVNRSAGGGAVTPLATRTHGATAIRE